MDKKQILKDLARPFPRIKWRRQNIFQYNGKYYANMFAYLEARQVADRLNDVLGFDGWSFTWEEKLIPRKMWDKSIKGYTEEKLMPLAVKGTLKIGDTIKEDVGYPNSTNSESEDHLKSAVSDALKRCAVHFGVGRFLYELKGYKLEYTGDDKYARPVYPEHMEKLETMYANYSTKEENEPAQKKN